MKSFIDIRSHILPGMDNGCETREEMTAMIRAYEELGTEAVICTPHFGLYGVKGRDEDKAWNWLRAARSPKSSGSLPRNPWDTSRRNSA